LGEAFLFTVRFEAPARFGDGPWWALLVHRSHLIVRVLLVIPIAIAAFGGTRLLIRFRRALEWEALGHDRWASWLVAHGVALAGFTRLTILVCDGELATSAHSGAWTLAWVGSGLMVGATWMAALLSPPTWVTLIRRSWPAIAMSASVSVAAFYLADYTVMLWDSMAGVTLVIVRSMLSLVSRNVTCDTTTMDLAVDGFKSRILPACSGFEGIGLILAFLSAYLWWFRNAMRWPHSLLLIPIGAVVIFFLNSVRIAALFLIGAWASPEVAMGAFHSQAGWLAFLGVSLGLVVASRRLSFFTAEPSAAGQVAELNPSAALLGPFLAVLATSMITSTFALGFDRLYGLRVLTGGAALWYFRRELAGLITGWSWAGVATGVVAFGLWVALEPASTGSGKALASAVGHLPEWQSWAWIAFRVIGSVAIVLAPRSLVGGDAGGRALRSGALPPGQARGRDRRPRGHQRIDRRHRAINRRLDDVDLMDT
jgi:exosortase/archaeosortase family protein